MKIAYCAMIEPQNGGGFTVTFPDLPDAITEGDTEEEALYNAAEVLTLTLDGRLAEGEAIPEPVYWDGVVVYPYPLCQAAVLVRNPAWIIPCPISRGCCKHRGLRRNALKIHITPPISASWKK